MKNEIMVNEELIEVTEDVVRDGSNLGFKMAVGFGLGLLVGVPTYKYIIKPIASKIRAKKEQRRTKTEFENGIRWK